MVAQAITPETPRRPRLSVVPDAPRRPRVLKPFTLPHFRRWCSDLILDNERSVRLEGFQEEFVKDLFAGYPECWLIVPEGNGKTTLLALVCLYHCEHRQFAAVPWAAASREQAEIGYRQAEGFVLRSPRLHAPVHSDVQAAKGKRKTEVPRFVCLEGYRRINHHAGGRIQIFAADDRTGDGIVPTLGVVDEPHRQRNLGLYRTWSGKLTKRQGQIVAISTRGEPGSDFEETLARIKLAPAKVRQRGSCTRIQTARIALHEWALKDQADPDDLRAVKAANPFSGVTVPLLREKRDTPTMTANHWLRFVCNRPATDFDNWLGPNAAAIWAGLAKPWELVPGAPTWVGVDIGLKRDSSAVVAVQYRPDEDGEPEDRMHLRCKLWVPTADEPVDVTAVMQYLRDLDGTYDVQAISFDPRFFDVPAKFLLDEGLPMMEIPQSLERMTMAVGDLYAAVMGGTVTHDGDPAFTAQVMAAQPRFNERGFTIAKGKSHGRIDAAVAAALAVDRAARSEPTTSVYDERGVLELG